MDAPQVINIGRADTTEAPTLKLNVGSDTEMGAIKLQKEPKSVNFGPGVEMLMNPKKTTTPRNVNLGDIETLDGDLNKKMGINKSDALKQAMNDSIKLNINELPNKPEISLKLPETNKVNLGNAAVQQEKAKTVSWDGYQKVNSIPVDPAVAAEKPRKSADEILREKFSYLRKLEAMEKAGIKLTKRYSMECSLAEMKGEYEMIKNEKEKRSSVKFQGKMLMAAVSALEFLNSKFDPFDLKLDGWSEAINENLDEYDDVFGELHEKYSGKAKIAPELKLLFMLGGSAAMLHMTNTMFKSSMPGMDDIMRQNPELMQQFTQAAVNSMSQENPGFGGFMNGMMGGGAPPPQQRPPQRPPSMRVPPAMRQPQRRPPPGPPGQGRRPDIGMGRGHADFNDAVNMENNFNSVPQRSSRRPRADMKGPENLDSILAGLKTKKINISEQKKADNNSTISVEELKEMKKNLPKKSKRKPRSERNSMALNI